MNGQINLSFRGDYRIKNKHSRECWANACVRTGDLQHPWGSHIGTLFLDILGRRNNGHTMWEVYCCNDPNCKAKLLVRTAAFLETAPWR